MADDDRDPFKEARDQNVPPTYHLLGDDSMARKERARQRRPLVIAASAVAGAMALVIVFVAVSRWRSEVATQRFQRAAQEAAQQAGIEAEELKRVTEAKQAAQQALLEQQAAQRLQKATERQRLEEEATRAAAEAVERKEAAWTKYYRKPAVCNDATTMECVNANIRAKRTFEEKYSRGELQ
jgi:LPS O-antigen subunit length determinant protein (WzzB/FepE family)